MSEAAPNPTIIPEQQPVEQAGRSPEVANLPPSYDFGRSHQLEVLTRTPATIEDALGVVELVTSGGDAMAGDIALRAFRNNDLGTPGDRPRQTQGLIGNQTADKVLRITEKKLDAWVLSDEELAAKNRLVKLGLGELGIPTAAPEGYKQKEWNDLSPTQKKNVCLKMGAEAAKDISFHAKVLQYKIEQSMEGAVPAEPRKQTLVPVTPFPIARNGYTNNNSAPRSRRGSLSVAEMEAEEAELRDNDSAAAYAENSRRTGRPNRMQPGRIGSAPARLNLLRNSDATTASEPTVELAESSPKEKTVEGLARDMHTGWLQSEGLPASERNLAIVMADGAKGYEHLRREAAAAAATPESAPVSTEAHVPSGGDLPPADEVKTHKEFSAWLDEHAPDTVDTDDVDAVASKEEEFPSVGLLDDFLDGEKTGRLARIGERLRSLRRRGGVRKLGSTALTGVRAEKEEPFTEDERD